MLMGIMITPGNC